MVWCFAVIAERCVWQDFPVHIPQSVLSSLYPVVGMDLERSRKGVTICAYVVTSIANTSFISHLNVL